MNFQCFIKGLIKYQTSYKFTSLQVYTKREGLLTRVLSKGLYQIEDNLGMLAALYIVGK